MISKDLQVFVSICLIVVGLSGVSSAWNVSSGEVNSFGNCAKIYFEKDFQGSSIFLKDKAQAQISNSLGGITEISVEIKPSCTLTIASQRSLRGSRYDLTNDTAFFQFQNGVTFENSSFSCSCKKSCSCEDISFRGKECARGYFHSDCSDCEATYTSFKEAGSVRFPSRIASSVTSFIVRPTCELTVHYSSEKSESGEEDSLKIKTNRKSEIVSFEGLISSTSCECDQSAPEYANSFTPRTSLPSDPPLIAISDVRAEINAELKKPGQENHPGLLAALQSLRAKRNPKNVYILLLGLSGSGKSTAVNLLFDQPNITQVGTAESTTKDIHEFKIGVPLPELGISNSELRLIDTPGTGDTTGGLTHDARFLATLDDFLSRHKDLRKFPPNVVLVFAKFTDNRFSGESSDFVKMLKTIELFRQRLIDPESSNVIFVLTHFMSESASFGNPELKIQQFKQVIQEHTTLPNPIVLVVAENKPEEFQLPNVNGYWRLPNGDLYPKNLFDQMQKTLYSCKDPIGMAVVQKAFSHMGEFAIESSTTELLNSSANSVLKYLSILTELQRPPRATEVTEALDAAYKELAPELKTQFPSVLKHLKQICALKRIETLSRVPTTSTAIVRFLKDVQMNPASRFLMERGLNLSVPVYKEHFFVGCGYDLLNDVSLGTPVFNLSQGLLPTEIGFQFPNALTLSLSSAVRNVFDILPNRNAYVERRLQHLGIEQKAEGLDNLLSTSGRTTRPGLNIVTSSDEEGLRLSAVIEYQKFNVILNKNATLSEDYLRDLRALKFVNMTESHESVTSWTRFFRQYGTHVAVWASGGGSIAVEVKMTDLYESQQQSDTPGDLEKLSEDRFTRLSRAMSLIMQHLADTFIGTEVPVTLPDGVSYSITMRGGDQKYFIHTVTPVNARGKQKETSNLLDDWQKSLRFYPEVLTSYLKLIPMAEVLSSIGGLEAESAALTEASRSFLNASLVYIPTVVVSRSSVDDRDHSGAFTPTDGDFQSMTGFANRFSLMATKEDVQSKKEFNLKTSQLQKEYQIKVEQLQTQNRNELQSKLKQAQEKWDQEMREAQVNLIGNDSLEAGNNESMVPESWKTEVKLRQEQLANHLKEIRTNAEAVLNESVASLNSSLSLKLMELRVAYQEKRLQMLAEENQRQNEMNLALLNRQGLMEWAKDAFNRIIGFIGNIYRQLTKNNSYFQLG